MSSSPPESRHKWRWWHPVLLLAILIAIIVVEQTWLKPHPPTDDEINKVIQTADNLVKAEEAIKQVPDAEEAIKQAPNADKIARELAVSHQKAAWDEAIKRLAIAQKAVQDQAQGLATQKAASDEDAKKLATQKAALDEDAKKLAAQKAALEKAIVEKVKADRAAIKGVWIVIMILMAAFIVVAGHGVTGYLRGVLIDSRNKISLARLQTAAWTALLVSAYLTAVLINIHRGQPEATDITLHPTLWALMGIATTSLVGSPLIKSSKAGQPGLASPPVGNLDKTLTLLSDQGVDTRKVDVEGSLIVNQSPNDASWMDLFRGEDITNAAHLDLGKIQMFFFTIITLATYGAAIGGMFDSVPGRIGSFPDLSSGIVALLGISHAGYLASKAASSPPSR